MSLLDYYHQSFWIRSSLDLLLSSFKSMVASGEITPDHDLLPLGATLLSDNWHYLHEGQLCALPLINPDADEIDEASLINGPEVTLNDIRPEENND